MLMIPGRRGAPMKPRTNMTREKSQLFTGSPQLPKEEGNEGEKNAEDIEVEPPVLNPAEPGEKPFDRSEHRLEEPIPGEV